MFYKRIPSNNWTLGVVFFEDEIYLGKEMSQRQLQTKIAMAVMAFLFFLSILIFRADKGGSRSLWAVALFLSVLFVIGMCFTWYLALVYPSDENSRDVDIFDRVGLEVALRKHLPNPEVGHSENQPKRVPTGVFLQTLEFSSVNNVILTGYIWQHYSDNETSEVCAGVFLPEAEAIEIKEAYRTGEVIGWYFRAVSRQHFCYSKYPFDRKDIEIKLWHEEFYRNIILTPDFNSYTVILPDSKPGLEQDLDLKGWKIEDSFFSYRNTSYNANFGIEDNKHTELPELYFNVGIERDFLSPFFSYMIRLAVVIFLLFAVLMISTKQKIALYGFTSSSVLAFCAAIFFVLSISHISLREQQPTGGVVYLEYFYLVMYLALLAVSINSILLASNNTPNFINYKDTLIVKLLYWPIIMGLFFGITLGIFY